MRVTASDAIGKTVIATLVILFEDGVQIAAVGINRTRQHPREVAELPVRPDKTDGKPGDTTPYQRVDNARQRHLKAFTQ